MIEYHRTIKGEEVAVFLHHDLTEDEEEKLSEEAYNKYFTNKKEEKENEWRIRHSYCIRW